MRTVTLELLRHGPSNNQLLSPLTPYLALCENHAPVTVTVPFEHNQFLHRLTALTYEFGMSQLADNQRQFQLADTGRELGRLLSSIPGLTAELSRHREQSSEVIHLRLVLSASELALLPFELVLAGNGFPGFGQPLLLQNQAPICLTREVRRVKEEALAWTPSVRVLFVCASPAGLPPVPVESHLLALRRAVDPWVGYFDADDDEARRRRVDDCLHVLPAATIGAIQDECARGGYSHVHVLAHGLACQDGFDLRFGIALHDAADPDNALDVVSGERLASALRPLERPDRDGFAKPMVVTLASCNGANGGSVVGAGASVAHALQVAGIPLVVAGQFPLTFDGSVELVETLYEGLLWGTDPRSLLMDLRRRMHVLQARSHDWAALTAYASLPIDFDEQLCGLLIGRARAALDIAMEHADQVLVATMMAKSGDRTGTTPTGIGMSQARDRIERPWKAISALVDRIPTRRFELLGLLASMGKRRAEIELAAFQLERGKHAPPAPPPADCLALLAQSRDEYLACFQERRDASWAIVQYVCLSLLLELPDADPPADPPAVPATQAAVAQPSLPVDAVPTASSAPVRALLSQERKEALARMWRLAWALSQEDLDDTVERQGWALGNLIELPLLAILMKLPLQAGEKPWEQQARDWVEALSKRGDAYATQVYASRRQLERYGYWFGFVNKRFSEVEGLAHDLALRFDGDSAS